MTGFAGRPAGGAPAPRGAAGCAAPATGAPTTGAPCTGAAAARGRGAHRSGAGDARSSRTTAKHAMPSTRPRLPRPSGRVAFTWTGAPAASERRATISSRRATIFGRSPTTVQSALTTRHPSAAARSTTVREQHEAVGPPPARVGVGEMGRRDRRGLPLRGSRRRRLWATTSASLWPRSARSPGNDATRRATSGRSRVVRRRLVEGVDVDTEADALLAHARAARRGPRSQARRAEVVGVGELEVARLAGHDHDGGADRLEQRGVVGRVGRAVMGAGAAPRRGTPAASARRRVSRARPSRPRVRRRRASRVSATGNAGIAPSAPAPTAATTAANSAGEASGRAASWTTTISAVAGTAPAPPAPRRHASRRRRRRRAPAWRDGSSSAARRDDEDHALGDRAGRVDRPLDDGPAREVLELLRAAEAATFAAGDDDRPDAASRPSGEPA